MKPITDDDLTLLFYGEHEDPELAASVAASEELSARFDALSAELRLADKFMPPPRGDDYGAEVWQKISPALEDKSRRTDAWWKPALSSVLQPRFSLTGAFSVALVAVLAFMLGRNGGQAPGADAGNPLNNPSVAMAEIDTNRLLTSSVSSHLEQVNLVLTQFVNSTEPATSEAGFATDMLVANRLYRQAATANGNHRIASFLASLEPLLIELAYEAQTASSASRERMQKEVRDGLLFRVRMMNQKLENTEISV